MRNEKLWVKKRRGMSGEGKRTEEGVIVAELFDLWGCQKSYQRRLCVQVWVDDNQVVLCHFMCEGAVWEDHVLDEEKDARGRGRRPACRICLFPEMNDRGKDFTDHHEQARELRHVDRLCLDEFELIKEKRLHLSHTVLLVSLDLI